MSNFYDYIEIYVSKGINLSLILSTLIIRCRFLIYTLFPYLVGVHRFLLVWLKIIQPIPFEDWLLK